MKEFLEIHSDNPREGPGDRESLDWALDPLDLPPDARVLDAGCGPGADIPGLLAHVPHARLVAMDGHAPYVDRVREAFAGDSRVRAVVGDMSRPEGRFGLIWCAGAIYHLGVEPGLRGWRDHLEPGGVVAFSELAWTGAPRSPEAQAFWHEGYPAMQDRAGVLAATRKAGYEVLADRFLPPAAWEAYYQPIEARMAGLRKRGPSAGLQAAMEAEQSEIDLWRAHGEQFGYLQVVARMA